MQVKRFPANPIITPALDESIGTNINGPSLLRVPDWLPNPLGRYYLYFAHHQGAFIRLAYADALAGPWTVYTPGTLRLEQTPCYHHIASPDVHIDQENRRILMYYHGPTVRREELDVDPLTQRFPFLGGQRSLLAMSDDGLNFNSDSEILGPSYFRVFRYPNAAHGWFYALGMPGILFRSRDGRTDFELGQFCLTATRGIRLCSCAGTLSTSSIRGPAIALSISSARQSICARIGGSGRRPRRSRSSGRKPTTRAAVCLWSYRCGA